MELGDEYLLGQIAAVLLGSIVFDDGPQQLRDISLLPLGQRWQRTVHKDHSFAARA
jgi:hypothetical protein